MLKMLRWMKGESAETARLRAEVFDEIAYGSANAADKLSTPRKINGVEFSGEADISLPSSGDLWKNLPLGFEYVQRSGYGVFGAIASGSAIFTLTADSAEISVGSKIVVGAVELTISSLTSGSLGKAESTYTLSGTAAADSSGYFLCTGTTGKTPSEMFGGGTWVNVSASWGGMFDRIEGGASPNIAAAFGGTQKDQMQVITGSFSWIKNKPYENSAASGAFSVSNNGGAYNTASLGSGSSPTFTFNSANSPNARAGSETRSANSTIRVLRLVAY